jgi:hypothetical protein
MPVSKAILAALAAAIFSGCVSTRNPRLEQLEAERKSVRANLDAFDTLDFDVFSRQEWGRLRESHAPDILVHWPDGRTTRGLEKHTDDLKAMFSYAPDTRIETHPVKFGAGQWTSVIGVMEGTFTQPMSMPDGRTLAPTGKRFKISMCTVGRWKNGVMVEEFLFWDNREFMKQIGADEAAELGSP